jgi:hypothetical protein
MPQEEALNSIKSFERTAPAPHSVAPLANCSHSSVAVVGLFGYHGEWSGWAGKPRVFARRVGAAAQLRR